MVPREGDSIMMPKPIGEKVPTQLLNKLKRALEVNDMEAAYGIGDEYLLKSEWDFKEISKCKKLAVEFMNRRRNKLN